MVRSIAKITERTLYPYIIKIIEKKGGTGVSEVLYNSEPDIIFNFQGRQWLLSVKIGESRTILKQAFLQYIRHKGESQINHGIMLFFPDKVRTIKPEPGEISSTVERSECTCLIDTPYIKDEFRRITFPYILLKIEQEVTPKLIRKEEKAYPLDTVISLMQEHVSDLMKEIKLSDQEMLRIITDKKLLYEIGHLKPKEGADISRFLAAYIILSQIMFLRLFSRNRPEVLPAKTKKINKKWLREAFKNIRDINYRPIYELDVLDAVPEEYIRDTFDLIWGLEIERVRHDLPGRIFHELMPKTIRKMLAAFYTRPQAADLLARLTIKKSNDTVLDPACGSGTILVSAYKRKLDLLMEEGANENPHKRFCEEEIFGSDIMPFAVHLTGANLASMEPGITIDKTQIIQGDSLELSKGISYKNGVQLILFPKAKKGQRTSGETYEVQLDKVDVVLMNPPFTKVERGIRKFVDMERFGNLCGKEVGLWGHFIALANEFLKEGGVFGAVIPVNVLRGRESKKVREFIFNNWTPLYVIKSTVNYGFSEYAEYRDILFISKKEKPSDNYKVKFVLIKKDLKKLTKDDIEHIANLIETQDSLRDDEIDIESFPISELKQRFNNMMWFCGANDLRNRDLIVKFFNKFKDKLNYPPKNYFREGYRPVPKGVSSFMFITRNTDESRIEQAFLYFNKEDQNKDYIEAVSTLNIKYNIEKSALLPSLRTATGIRSFHLKGNHDYVAFIPYKELNRVIKASGFKKPKGFEWISYWKKVKNELEEVKSHIVALHRIGPSSPNNFIVSIYSDIPIYSSNVLNIIKESNKTLAKAFCVVLNSIIFLSQFILLKEESTARYVNLRFYDYEEMLTYPKMTNQIKKLAEIFDQFSDIEFKSIRDQLDNTFEQRYEAFWKERRKGQRSLFSFEKPGEPAKERIEFDLKVCKALGIDTNEEELRKIYDAIVKEMIVTRGLKRE